MKRYRDATVVSSTLEASALARYIESFADTAAEWEFPAEKSALYEQMCGSPSCCVVAASASLPRAAVHLSVPREEARSLTVTNIIPLAADQLGLDEYNALLVSFARALRTHARLNAVPIKVTLSKANIRLSDVVTGKLPWKLLQCYLSAYPLSRHPLDIGRLDKFICGLSRYQKKHLDLDAFQVLLMEELGWSADDAAWCRERVEIGLEVLAVSRSFYVR